MGDASSTKPAGAGGVHIGEVVERTGLSHRTLRYYEEMGLITPVARTDGGFRLYDQAGIDRLLLIKPMKPLGFAIEDMRRLLDALDVISNPDSDPEQIAAARAIASQLDADTRNKVAELEVALQGAKTFEKSLRNALG